MTDSSRDTKLSGTHEQDDEAALEELRRLSAKFVSVESESEDGAQNKSDGSIEDPLQIIERLASQHDTMDQGVGKVLFRYQLLVYYLYCLFFYSIYTLVEFYRSYDLLAEYSFGFRIGMVSVICGSFAITNIVFRTHGNWMARITGQRLFMSVICICTILAMPARFMPPAVIVIFMSYFYFRRDNRNRVIIFAIIVLMCSGAAFVSPWMPNPIYPAFFGALCFGMGGSLLLRKAATFRSGGALVKTEQFTTWWSYEQARENLGALDIILESENRYAPSRVTTMTSRSPWTHSGLIVKNPSDEVKELYGVLTHEQIMLQLSKQIQTVAETDEGRAARNKAITRLERELNEELYVFEAVRPVVALTPLCTWMSAKEEAMAYKVIAVRRLKMYEGRAKVTLDMGGLEELMLKLHGTPFALQAKSMVKANYQFNTERFEGSIFCSELVAEVYQRVGLLTEKRLSSNFTPKDFSSNEETKLLVDARFYDEVRIRNAPPGTPEGG